MKCLYENHILNNTSNFKEHLYKCYKNLYEKYKNHEINKPQKFYQCKNETIFYLENERENHLKTCKYCIKYYKKCNKEKNRENDESLNIKISNNKKNFLDDISQYKSTIPIIKPEELTNNEIKKNEEEQNNSTELNIFFDIL